MSPENGVPPSPGPSYGSAAAAAAAAAVPGRRDKLALAVRRFAGAGSAHTPDEPVVVTT